MKKVFNMLNRTEMKGVIGGVSDTGDGPAVDYNTCFNICMGNHTIENSAGVYDIYSDNCANTCHGKPVTIKGTYPSIP